VEAWDVSALPPLNAAARQLLLRRDDEATRMLGGLPTNGAIGAGTGDMAALRPSP
jgi:hypothetical protein